MSHFSAISSLRLLLASVECQTHKSIYGCVVLRMLVNTVVHAGRNIDDVGLVVSNYRKSFVLSVFPSLSRIFCPGCFSCHCYVCFVLSVFPSLLCTFVLFVFPSLLCTFVLFVFPSLLCTFCPVCFPVLVMYFLSCLFSRPCYVLFVPTEPTVMRLVYNHSDFCDL